MPTDFDGGSVGGGGYSLAEPTPVPTFYPQASPHYPPFPPISRPYRAPASPILQHQQELRSYGTTPPSPALTSSSTVLSPLIHGPSFAQHHPLLHTGVASQHVPSHPSMDSFNHQQAQYSQSGGQPYPFPFPPLESRAGPTRRLTVGSQDREDSPLQLEGGHSFAQGGRGRIAGSFSTGDSRFINEMREMTDAEIKEEKRRRVSVMMSD